MSHERRGSGLAFYNSGEFSGRSQPHKHLQVRLPKCLQLQSSGSTILQCTLCRSTLYGLVTRWGGNVRKVPTRQGTQASRAVFFGTSLYTYTHMHKAFTPCFLACYPPFAYLQLPQRLDSQNLLVQVVPLPLVDQSPNATQQQPAAPQHTGNQQKTVREAASWIRQESLMIILKALIRYVHVHTSNHTTAHDMHNMHTTCTH